MFAAASHERGISRDAPSRKGGDAMLQEAPRELAMVRACVISPLLKVLDEDRTSADALLAKHGLCRRELTDPHGRVPLGRYVALFEAAADQRHDPHLGLKLGAGMRPADLGPLGVLFAASPTIRTGLAAFARSLSALQSCTANHLQDANDFGSFEYRIADAAIGPRVQDTDFSLAALVGLCRKLADHEWHPLEVHFDHPAFDDVSIYRDVFNCSLLFDQPTARLVISRDELDAVRQSTDEDLLAILERHVADLAGQSEVAPSLPAQVRALVRSRLLLEKISTARVARDLGFSARSLQRELGAAGTSVRTIVREERFALAQSHLKQCALSKTVACSVGYADSTTFWRAFRSWTGMSPSAFRRLSKSQL